MPSLKCSVRFYCNFIKTQDVKPEGGAGRSPAGLAWPSLPPSPAPSRAGATEGLHMGRDRAGGARFWPLHPLSSQRSGNHATRTKKPGWRAAPDFSSLRQRVGSGKHEEVYLSEGFPDHGRVVVRSPCLCLDSRETGWKLHHWPPAQASDELPGSKAGSLKFPLLPGRLCYLAILPRTRPQLGCRKCVQAGFRKGRGTRDQIANICWIIEKAREFQKNIYFCFIDYAKAFDCVDHNKLWKILKEMGYQTT